MVQAVSTSTRSCLLPQRGHLYILGPQNSGCELCTSLCRGLGACWCDFVFGVNAACTGGARPGGGTAPGAILLPAWERCSVLPMEAAGGCGCPLPGTCACFPLNKEKATPKHLLSVTFDLLHVPPAK